MSATTASKDSNMSHTIELYPGEFAAKIAREAKDRPTDWLLVPEKNGIRTELHHLAAPANKAGERRRKLVLVT